MKIEVGDRRGGEVEQSDHQHVISMANKLQDSCQHRTSPISQVCVVRCALCSLAVQYDGELTEEQPAQVVVLAEVWRQLRNGIHWRQAQLV